MFALTRGELAMVVFLFVLVLGAVLLPRLGEYVGARLSKRARSGRQYVQSRSPGDRG
jgi:Sec-independent protein translocase protein TatA